MYICVSAHLHVACAVAASKTQDLDYVVVLIYSWDNVIRLHIYIETKRICSSKRTKQNSTAHHSTSKPSASKHNPKGARTHTHTTNLTFIRSTVSGRVKGRSTTTTQKILNKNDEQSN